MKITKSPKRQPEVVPEVASLCATLTEAPEAELPNIISQSSSWPWPRGDLYSWVSVLNRFDELLERIVAEHDMNSFQRKPFSQYTKELLLSILFFSRLLLENCMNRKLYASSEHLDSLLATDDIEVLEAVLYLLLRRAQQYSGSVSSRHDLGVPRSRLTALSVVWPPREAGMDLAGSVEPESRALDLVNFSYYMRQAPGTPGPAMPAEGAVRVTVRNLHGTAQEKMAEVDHTHMSPEEQFELFHRIRVGLAFTSAETRKHIITCRLLAIACYSHAVSDSTANNQLFLFEPSIIQHIAALVPCTDAWVSATAMYALEAFGHQRSHLHEVLSATNASVAHGILLQKLQDVVEQLQKGFSCSRPDAEALVDSIIALIAFITTTISGGNMIIGAGLIPQLVSVATLASRDDYLVQRTATRVVGLLDSIIAGYPPAFDIFCTASGVDKMVGRVSDEVHSALDEANSSPMPFRLAYGRVALLRIILKLFSHLMTTPGTADGLRNLIDTPLAPALKAIMENHTLFGSHALAHVINITAIFVHNEPTLLAIIQEKGLSDAFLAVMHEPLDSSFEVLSAATTAIGALSLNEAGLKVFAEQPVVRALVSCLGHSQYTRMLLERDNACMFGTAIDELVRHHPTFRVQVGEAILGVVDGIINDGRQYPLPQDEEARSHFVLCAAEAPPAPTHGIRESDTALDHVDNVGQYARESPQPVSAMDVLCRFLEGLFRNPARAREFLQMGGLVHLMPYYGLPCLPYNFAASASADSYVSVMRNLVEADPTLVATQLFKELAVARAAAMPILVADTNGTSRTVPLLAPADVNDANVSFRSLVTLCARVHLLADMFHTFSSGDPKIALAFLEVSADNDVLSLAEISDLLRACSWEALLFKASVSDIKEDETPLGRNLRALRYVVTQTPAALRSFVGELVSLTMLRRVFKPQHYRLAINVADACGQMISSLLEPRAGVSRENVYAELSHNLAFVASMLFDYHENIVMTIYASVVVSFEKCGGIEAIVRLVRACHAELGDSEGQLRAHIVGSLRATLAIFRHLVDAPKLTGALRDMPVREGDEDSSDVRVQPFSFALRLRFAAFDAYADLLKDTIVETVPVDVVRLLIETLILVSMSEKDKDSEETMPPPFDRLGDGFAKMRLEPFIRLVRAGEPLPDVNEEYLEHMVNMGFGRLGARFSLWHNRNQLDIATAFLLTHTDIASLPEEFSEQTKIDTEHKKAFNAKRIAFMPTLLERAIELTETFDQVSFEVAEICKLMSNSEENAGKCLEHVAPTLEMPPQPLARRLHTTLLLLSDATIQKKLPWAAVEPLGYMLIDLIETQGRDPSVWLSGALLNLCFIFGFTEMPTHVPIIGQTKMRLDPKDERPLVMPERLALRNRYASLVDYLIWAIEHVTVAADRMAVFRLAAVLTRRSESAAALVEKGGVQLLVRALHTRDIASVSGCQQLVIMTLRHVAEMGDMLSTAMMTEVRTWVEEKLRVRPSDGTSFSSGMAYAVLRDPSKFLGSAEKTVEVSDLPRPDNPFLSLRQEMPPLESGSGNDLAVRILLDELFETAAHLPEENPEPENPDNGEPKNTAESTPETKNTMATTADARKGYTIFLMQCLSELLSSYVSCKQTFLGYTRNGESALALFFNELVPAGFVHGRSKEGLRLRMAVSNWAMSVIVSLGTDVALLHNMKEVPASVVAVRKALLDALSRALRDTSSTNEQIETRYGRLYSLADMCHRLLTIRVAPRDVKPPQEVVLHMAKTMLEKNFVTVLTTALSQVDLGVPSVKALLDSILRPLEHLTKVAIKMGKARRHKPVEQQDSSGSESYSDASDMSDEYGSAQSYSDNDDNQDAPDFYRNSALGMHTGEMEQGHYDEEMSDSNDEVEVDEYSDSEEHSELSTDMESLDGDSAHVVEVMDEDDDGEVDEDEDEGEEEGGEGSISEESASDEGDFYDEDELEFDDDGEEIAAEPMDDSVGGLLAALDNMGDNGVIEPEEDGSDDFYADDIGQLEVDDDGPESDHMHSHAPWSSRRMMRDSVPLMMPSAGAENMHLLSSHLGPSRAASPQTPSHPLLVDQEQARPQRQMPTGYADWARSVETLVGGGTMQFLEMLLSSGVNAGADTSIRIEIPEHGRGAQHINIANVEPQAPERQEHSGPDIIGESQNFVPMSTRNRWMMEMRMIHGNDGPRRGEHVRNHLVNALLPAFFERRRRKEAEKYEAAVERNRREQELRETQRVRDEAMRELRESKQRLEQLEIETGQRERDSEMQDAGSHAPQNESSSEPRVTVQVHGRTVDLTGTGVDPTFLEALPDELREEALLSQDLGDRLAQASGSSVAMRSDEPVLGIASDFLDALPAALRAELAQHTDLGIGRSHSNERQTPLAASPAPASPAPPTREAAPQTPQRPQEGHRDAIQLLDRAGIATLVRLLYFPQMNTRQSILYKVLAHLAENARSRTELLNLLLMVLSDGTDNTSAVERSFAAMSSRASRGTATPTRTPRRGTHSAPDTPGSSLMAPLATIGDEAAGLVATRSIEALMHLVQSNEQAALYFLREDVRAPKKAKSRERAEMAEKGSAPINILLGLLEKDAILGNAQLVDAVISLMNAITKPLDELKMGDTQESNAESSEGAQQPSHPLSQSESQQPPPPPQLPPSTPGLGEDANQQTDGAQPVSESTQTLSRAPYIPAERLSFVVRPLTTSISSRGFQQTLSVFVHLSHIPGARDTISNALQHQANAASASLITDLDSLIASLPPASEEPMDANESLVASGSGRVHSPALTKLASPASAQAVFLRSLRALEYLYVGR